MSRHKCKWTALTLSSHCSPRCAASCMGALSLLCSESLSSVCPAFWTGFLHLSASFAPLLSSIPLLTASLILLCQPSCSFSPFDLISLHRVFKISIGKSITLQNSISEPVQSTTDWSKRPWKSSCIELQRHLQSSSLDKMEKCHFHFPLLNGELLNFVAPQYGLTLLCTSHHIYPKKWPIPQYICICTVSFKGRRLKIECLDKNSVCLYFIYPCSVRDTFHFDLWLPENKRSKKSEKETSLSNNDSNWTQLKLQFYTESWWGNCTRNCVSQSSCWQEHYFFHTHKWFAGPPRP